MGITNTLEGPLAKQATATILTQAGNECFRLVQTYVASRMALQWRWEIFFVSTISVALVRNWDKLLRRSSLISTIGNITSR